MASSMKSRRYVVVVPATGEEVDRELERAAVERVARPSRRATALCAGEETSRDPHRQPREREHSAGTAYIAQAGTGLRIDPVHPADAADVVVEDAPRVAGDRGARAGIQDLGKPPSSGRPGRRQRTAGAKNISPTTAIKSTRPYTATAPESARSPRWEQRPVEVRANLAAGRCSSVRGRCSSRSARDAARRALP